MLMEKANASSLFQANVGKFLFNSLISNINSSSCRFIFAERHTKALAMTHRSRTSILPIHRSTTTMSCSPSNVMSTMTHRSTHPLGDLSPQTRHAFDTVERSSLSWGLLRCNACGACNSPTQQCLAVHTTCACMTERTHWIISPLKLDMCSASF